jgi:hypothetical protein
MKKPFGAAPSFPPLPTRGARLEAEDLAEKTESAFKASKHSTRISLTVGTSTVS